MWTKVECYRSKFSEHFKSTIIEKFVTLQILQVLKIWQMCSTNILQLISSRFRYLSKSHLFGQGITAADKKHTTTVQSRCSSQW
jgi:hypothetical protein